MAPLAAIAADPVQPGKSGADASRDRTTIQNASGNTFRGPITAVDKEAQTITVNDAKMGIHTIHVGDKTKGVTGAQAANWSELKVGAEVHGVCRKDGEKFHAESLSLGK